MLAAAFVGAALAMLVRGEAGAVAATLTLVIAAGTLAVRAPAATSVQPDVDADAADLLTSSPVHGARPPAEPRIRPRACPQSAPAGPSHRGAPGPRSREIVVMTVRLVGSDGLEHSESASMTAGERLLFSRVLALAERYGRHVRLAVVPARDVAEAVIATAIRVRASELYAGESATVSADAQARRLGDAWEKAQASDATLRS